LLVRIPGSQIESRADARHFVNDDPDCYCNRGRDFLRILRGLSSVGEVAGTLSSAQAALVIGNSSLSRLHSPGTRLSNSHLWLANYSFPPENKPLGRLALDGALPYAFPP